MAAEDASLAKGEVIQLPVIDISETNTKVGHEMIDAAVKYGFFYIQDLRDENFDADVVDRAFELVLPFCARRSISPYLMLFAQSRKFFSSPREEKEECSINVNASAHYSKNFMTCI